MPIYEYSCPHCRKNFEEWLKSDDDASSHPCPACGTSSPRIISQTTFILKGGGWYVTEYGAHHAESEEPPRDRAEDAAKDTKDTTHGTSPDAARQTPGATKSEPGAETKPAAPKTSGAGPAPRAASKAVPSTSGTKPAKPVAASAGA